MRIKINQMHDQNHLNDFKIGQIYLVYLTDENCFWPAKIIEVNPSRQKYQTSKKIKVQFYQLVDPLNKARRQTIDLKKTKPGEIVSFEDVFVKKKFGQKVRVNQKDKAISKKLDIAMNKAENDFEQTLKSSRAYLRLRRIANQNKNKLNKQIEPSPFSSSVSSRSQRYCNRDQSRSQFQKQKETSINRGSLQYQNFVKQNQGKQSRTSNKKSSVKQEPKLIKKIVEEKYQKTNHSKSKDFNNKKSKTTSEKKLQIVQLKRSMRKILENQSNNQIDSSIQNIEAPRKKRKGSQIAINIQRQKQNTKFLIETDSSRSNRKSKIIKLKQPKSEVYDPNQDVSLKKQQKIQIDDIKQQKVEKLQQRIRQTSNYLNSKNILNTQIFNAQSNLVGSSNKSLNKNKSTKIAQKANIPIDKKQEEFEQNDEKPLNEILRKQLFREQPKNLRLILQQKLFFESYFKNVAPCNNTQKYLIYAQLISEKEKIQIQNLNSRKMFSFVRILDIICEKSQIKKFVPQNILKKQVGNKSKHTFQIVEEKDQPKKGRKVSNSIKNQLQEEKKKTPWDRLSEGFSFVLPQREENKAPSNKLQMETIQKLNRLNKIFGLIDILKIISAQNLITENFQDRTEKKNKYVIFFILNNHQPIKKQEKRQQSIEQNQMDTQSCQNSIGKEENNYQNKYDFMIWNVNEFIIHSFYSLLTSLNLFFSLKTEQNNSGSNFAQIKELLNVKRFNKNKEKKKQLDSRNKFSVQESISLNNSTTNRTVFSQTSLNILVEDISIVSQLYINLVFQKTKPNLNPKITISNLVQRDNLINFRKKYNIGFPFYDFFISKQLKKLQNNGIECIKGEIEQKQRNKKKVIEDLFKKMKQNIKFLIQIYSQSQYISSGQNIKQSQANEETNKKFQSLKQIIKRNYCLEKDYQLRTQFQQSFKIPESLKTYIKQEFQSLSTNSEYDSLSFRKINHGRDVQTQSKDNPPEIKYSELDLGIKKQQKHNVREIGSITYSNRDPRLKRKRLLNYSQPTYSESKTEVRSDINGPSTNNSSIYSNQQSYLHINQQKMVKCQSQVPQTSIKGSKSSFNQLDHSRSSHVPESVEESTNSLNQTLTTVYENQLSINHQEKKCTKQSQQEMHSIRTLQNQIISQLKELFIYDLQV